MYILNTFIILYYEISTQAQILLILMFKVTRLAQFALTSSCQRRIPENLAVGMAQLGPVMTFEFVGKVSAFLKFWLLGKLLGSNYAP